MQDAVVIHDLDGAAGRECEDMGIVAAALLIEGHGFRLQVALGALDDNYCVGNSAVAGDQQVFVDVFYQAADFLVLGDLDGLGRGRRAVNLTVPLMVPPAAFAL